MSALTREICERAKIRFWSYVDQSDQADRSRCWKWTGTVHVSGYGVFTVRPGFVVGAHRVSYVLANGVDLDQGRKQHICHSCDNPICVNPSHLFLGAPRDNTKDAVKKGRWPQGQQWRGRPSAKRIVSDELLKEAVEAIRGPKGALSALAVRAGVKYATLQSAAWLAIRGRGRHVSI